MDKEGYHPWGLKESDRTEQQQNELVTTSSTKLESSTKIQIPVSLKKNKFFFLLYSSISNAKSWVVAAFFLICFYSLHRRSKVEHQRERPWLYHCCSQAAVPFCSPTHFMNVLIKALKFSSPCHHPYLSFCCKSEFLFQSHMLEAEIPPWEPVRADPGLNVVMSWKIWRCSNISSCIFYSKQAWKQASNSSCMLGRMCLEL